MEGSDKLLRVSQDDPDYRRLAAAEMKFWREIHPQGLDALEQTHGEGPVDRYINERFTGERNVCWEETLARRGVFRRGAILGTRSLELEALGSSRAIPLCT